MNPQPDTIIGEGSARRQVIEVDRIGGRVATVRYRRLSDQRMFISGISAFARIVRGEVVETVKKEKRAHKPPREIRDECHAENQ